MAARASQAQGADGLQVVPVRSLLVAWRRKAVRSWSAGIPFPSSVTRWKGEAPWAISTVTLDSSGVDGVLHQLLGRRRASPPTSPAAIRSSHMGV